MQNLEVDLNSLCQLMDEEVSAHHLLIEEMMNESECLRKGSVNSLMGVVKRIEQQRETILILQNKIQESIHKFLEVHGKKGDMEDSLTNLLAVLPVFHHERIKFYRTTLRQLKGRIQRINVRNKLFVEESLAYLRDIISWLIHPVFESPGYIQTGREKSNIPLPYAFNREV